MGKAALDGTRPSADGIVRHVNSADDIYRWTGDQGSAGWTQVSGSLKAISAGSRTNVWGATGDGIYRYSNNDADP
ncbi:tectonin domain-containing protein [Streptomyces sp. NPDC097727]|uniref:tectonin domain-containing protein n=1 Tax=Streptomyces sp. NPDC097727 TaxID=3366092 RepID=UPI0037F51E5D